MGTGVSWEEGGRRPERFSPLCNRSGGAPVYVGPANPATWVDHDGWERFYPGEVAARTTHIIANGLRCSLEVTLWQPRQVGAPLEDGLWVIELHPLPGWTNLHNNPLDAPWGHHRFLIRPRDI